MSHFAAYARQRLLVHLVAAAVLLPRNNTRSLDQPARRSRRSCNTAGIPTCCPSRLLHLLFAPLCVGCCSAELTLAPRSRFMRWCSPRLDRPAWPTAHWPQSRWPGVAVVLGAWWMIEGKSPPWFSPHRCITVRFCSSAGLALSWRIRPWKH